MRILITALTIAFLSFGCSTGLHSSKMSELLKISDYTVREKEISSANPSSFGNAAVWMNIETMNRRGGLESKWKWEQHDVNIAKSYLDSMVKDGQINGYKFVKTSELETKTVESLAKKAGEDADSAIVIKTLVEVDWYFNPAAILDLTIIAAYWIPGSNRDALAKTKIEFIDLKHKKLLFSSEGEELSRICEPAFLIDTNEVVSEAKINSLREAFKGLYKKMLDFRNRNTRHL
jgi:hypothetical protein